MLGSFRNNVLSELRERFQPYSIAKRQSSTGSHPTSSRTLSPREVPFSIRICCLARTDEKYAPTPQEKYLLQKNEIGESVLSGVCKLK